jgi:hypothetical protein
VFGLVQRDWALPSRFAGRKQVQPKARQRDKQNGEGVEGAVSTSTVAAILNRIQLRRLLGEERHHQDDHERDGERDPGHAIDLLTELCPVFPG